MKSKSGSFQGEMFTVITFFSPKTTKENPYLPTTTGILPTQRFSSYHGFHFGNLRRSTYPIRAISHQFPSVRKSAVILGTQSPDIIKISFIVVEYRHGSSEIPRISTRRLLFRWFKKLYFRDDGFQQMRKLRWWLGRTSVITFCGFWFFLLWLAQFLHQGMKVGTDLSTRYAH